MIKGLSGALRALTKYSEKDMKERGPKKKRGPIQQPERDLTQKPCMQLMKSWGWSMEIYSAKATYDPRTSRWKQQAMKKGTPDSAGCTDQGHSAFVEFKAPGHLRGFNHPKNYYQKLFIKTKIDSGAFACVVDSPELLTQIYKGWLALKDNQDQAKYYLHKMLP